MTPEKLDKYGALGIILIVILFFAYKVMNPPADWEPPIRRQDAYRMIRDIHTHLENN